MVVGRTTIKHVGFSDIVPVPGVAHVPGHAHQGGSPVDHRAIDDLTPAGLRGVTGRSQQTHNHIHRATAKIGHHIKRRNRSFRGADGVQCPSQA